MRQTLFAIAAAAALAVVAVPSTASAAHFGGHFGRFEGGRNFGGPRFSFGFGVAPFYDYAYAGPSCYQVHRVWTPFGWRWRRVWVC